MDKSMEEIIEYTTVYADNIKDLDVKVGTMIKKGYQPYGSPYASDVGEFVACQAMVKYKFF